MILTVSTIETRLLDPRGQGPFGEHAADYRRGILIAAIGRLLVHALFERTRRGQGPAGDVVDQLAGDVFQTAMHRQSGAFRVPTDLLPDVMPPPLPPRIDYLLLFHGCTLVAN